MLPAPAKSPEPAPPPVPAAQSVEDVLGEELKGLRLEIEELIAGGLSDEEAQGLLDWAAELEGKVKAVASVLSNPGPDEVSRFLRFVAAGVSATRSRRFASSSLRLLQAALDRAGR